MLGACAPTLRIGVRCEIRCSGLLDRIRVAHVKVMSEVAFDRSRGRGTAHAPTLLAAVS